jgi:Protein of unknown function (DUF4435)/AAA domain, putative AbiEii toxin, Type IV TA system
MTASIQITFPGNDPLEGMFPVIILGPNGSGKTRLAQQITSSGDWTTIGAQRRTWLDDQLPLVEERNQNAQINHYQSNWRTNAWQPTEEISYLFSQLAQEHLKRLSRNNEAAVDGKTAVVPVTDTNLMILQRLWRKVYPFRKLEVDGFFPKVSRTDNGDEKAEYQVRYMSDGERTALYLAAKVLSSQHTKILVDEPELHLHSRLAIEFWSELEVLRPDCRFVYITHDLSFALSRREGKMLTIQPEGTLRPVGTDLGHVTKEVLGAATLPFHAKRIIFYEGEEGRGFASKFFKSWFNDRDTFVVAAGNRDSVCAAVIGLVGVGVAGAAIIGFVDSDYYSDAANSALRTEVIVLKLHEIESAFCIEPVVRAISTHLGKPPDDVWSQFINRIKTEFAKKPKSHLVATRVRFRVTDLLRGAFDSTQIEENVASTLAKHQSSITAIDINNQLASIFEEEERGVDSAIDRCDETLFKLLPGKHLLSLLSQVLGFRDTDELIDLTMSALVQKNVALATLGAEIESALTPLLASRKISSA